MKAAGWRKASAVTLIVLGCVILALSILVLWLKSIVLDTDRYVDTVSPLAADPAVQQAVSDRISSAVFDPASFDQRARETLPAQVSFLAPLITDRMQTLVNDLVQDAIASARFQQLWADANRASHTLVVRLLTGNDGLISVTEGKIAIDLESIREDVAQRLEQRGISVPDRAGASDRTQELVLFDSPVLAKIQGLVNLLVQLAWLLPILTLAAFTGAVWLAARRLFALSWSGLGVALTVAVILIVAAQLRTSYLDSLTGDVSRDAAAASFDIIFGSLRTTLQSAFVAGLGVAAAAFIAGSSPLAIRLRGTVLRAIQRAGSAAPTGKTGTWVAGQKKPLRIAGLIVCLMVLVFAGQLTPLLLIITGGALLVWLGLLELLSAA